MSKTIALGMVLLVPLLLQGCAGHLASQRMLESDTRYCEPGSAIARTLPAGARVIPPARPASEGGTCKS